MIYDLRMENKFCGSFELNIKIIKIINIIHFLHTFYYSVVSMSLSNNILSVNARWDANICDPAVMYWLQVAKQWPGLPAVFDSVFNKINISFSMKKKKKITFLYQQTFDHVVCLLCLGDFMLQKVIFFKD